MREIKFRAWDTEENKWFPNPKEYSWINLTHEGEIVFGYDGGDVEDGSGRFEIMQYTGLKDKNGKEIYEGDIVRWSDGDWKGKHNPRIATVKINPDIQFEPIWKNLDVFHFGNFIYKNTEHHLEVIGNIYEKPELLEASHG